MNKMNLIEILQERAGLTKNESDMVVNLFFHEIADELANGDRVEIRGLCSFTVKTYAEYTGRNWKNGERSR